MERLEDIIDVLNETLDTKMKRHIVGGILLSIALFFGGLSITVVTIKEESEMEDKNNGRKEEPYY